MTTMLGRKAAWGERTCGCCEGGHSKRAWKRIERRQWRKEAEA